MEVDKAEDDDESISRAILAVPGRMNASARERSTRITHSGHLVKGRRGRSKNNVERRRVELRRCNGKRVNVSLVKRTKARVGSTSIGVKLQCERSIHSANVASSGRPLQTLRPGERLAPIRIIAGSRAKVDRHFRMKACDAVTPSEIIAERRTDDSDQRRFVGKGKR
jgi:hypothetical protein